MSAPGTVQLVRAWRDEAREADQAGKASAAAALRSCAERLLAAITPEPMTECPSCAKRGRITSWCTSCDGWGIV